MHKTIKQSQLRVALSKWESVKAGNQEVFSEQNLDDLLNIFSPQDTEDSTLFYLAFVTIPNPQQIGTKDQYLGFIKGKQSDADLAELCRKSKCACFCGAHTAQTMEERLNP